MIYIILSILCSSLLVIILRYFKEHNIHSTYGIVWNYFFCCVTGLIILDNRLGQVQQYINWNYALIPVALGFLFFSVFSLIGKSTATIGISTTAIAFKLSFVIPVAVAFFLYDDAITSYKVIGILIAIVAIYLITFDASPKHEEHTATHTILFPILIFIGSGLCDVIFNYIQQKLFIIGWEHIINIAVFFGAFLISFILNAKNKALYQPRNILGGLILGVPNYFSLYYMLLALNKSNLEPSKIFPINNIGIVCTTTLVGILVFKEHFTTQKTIGFVLALLSILIIGFYNTLF